MPRKTSRNKSYYHYLVHYHDDEGELEDAEYFLTLFDIMEKFKVCRKTLMTQLRDPERRTHKLKGIKLFRVHEPVKKELSE